MTQLTPHFSVAEMTVTKHVTLDNTPGPVELQNMQVTARGLETARSILGDKPMTINSGYRSPAVNAAVKGVPDSAHLDGYAADFICPAFGVPLAICETLAHSGLKFDQVIQEGTWVHISFAPAMRQQVLTKTSSGYSEGL